MMASAEVEDCIVALKVSDAVEQLDAATSSMEQLSQLTRQEEHRDSLARCASEYVAAMTLYLQALRDAHKDKSESKQTHLWLYTLIFRTMRNSCVQQQVIQNLLAEQAANLLLTAVSQIASQNLLESEEILPCIRAGGQCLGNMVTGNSETQAKLWSLDNYFPTIGILCNTSDIKVVTSATMTLYNSVCNNDSRRNALIDTDDGMRVVRSLLLATAKTEETSEWIILLIENLLEKELFPKMYSRLEETVAGATGSFSDLSEDEKIDRQQKWQNGDLCKLITLQILDNLLPDREASDPGLAGCKPVQIPDSALKYLVERYRMITYLAKDGDWWDQPTSRGLSFALVLLSKILGNLSIYLGEKAQNVITTGLENTVEVLRSILERRDPKRLDWDEKGDTTSPEYGVARELVTLIGHACHNHRKNQDAFRDLEGMPWVLRATYPDVNNPFIRERAIVTIRNLCYNNLENQQVIKDIEKQPNDVVNTEDLEKYGVEVSLDKDTGKLRVKNKPKQPQ